MKNTRLTEKAKAMIGRTIEIKWGTSRGRDSYGYTTASLYFEGKRRSACNGGGYDMRGNIVGNWVASTFKDELLKLKEKDMPEHSHWQPDHSRVCDGKCREALEASLLDAIEKEFPYPREVKLASDCYECPTCKGKTRQSRDGKTVQDGRSFCGLTFHDPNYDPSKAVIGKDCSDRTLTNGDVGSLGKTVEEAEKAGNSFGLERYQAIYKASSKFATKRHTEPSIDGACGFSEVQKVLRAIGLDLKSVCDRKNLDIYEIVQAVPSKY